MASEFIETMQKLEDVTRILAKMGSTTVEEAVSRIKSIAYFMDKYGDIAELFQRLKEIEEKLYLCWDMLTVDEAALYLGVSKSQIYNMTSNREITLYKPKGKIIYFDRKNLDEVLRRNPILSRNMVERSAITDIMDIGAKARGRKRQKGDGQ